MKKIYLILFAASMFMVSCDKANDCTETQTENQEVIIPDQIQALMETGSVVINAEETRGVNDRIITTNNYFNNGTKEYNFAYFYEDDNLKIPLVLERPVICNYTVWRIGMQNGNPAGGMSQVLTKTIEIPVGVVSYLLYSGPYTPPAVGGIDYRCYVVTNSMRYKY